MSGTPGELPYPVPERSRAGIPTENASESVAPRKLPYPVPEESQLQKEEVQVPSQNSVKDIKPLGEAGHEDSTNPVKAATEIKEQSEGAKSRETLEGCSETTTTVSSGSVINKSVERGIVSSRVTEGSESFRVAGNSKSSRDVGKVPAEGKSNDSPSSNSTIQAIGSSGTLFEICLFYTIQDRYCPIALTFSRFRRGRIGIYDLRSKAPPPPSPH